MIKIMKHILAGIVMFIAGLEIGAFGMWGFTLIALKSPSSSERRTNHVSYGYTGKNNYDETD